MLAAYARRAAGESSAAVIVHPVAGVGGSAVPATIARGQRSVTAAVSPTGHRHLLVRWGRRHPGAAMIVDCHVHLQPHGERPPVDRERVERYVEHARANGVDVD